MFRIPVNVTLAGKPRTSASSLRQRGKCFMNSVCNLLGAVTAQDDTNGKDTTHGTNRDLDLHVVSR